MKFQNKKIHIYSMALRTVKGTLKMILFSLELNSLLALRSGFVLRSAIKKLKRPLYLIFL